MPSAGAGSLPPAPGASGPRVGMGLLFYPRGGSAFVVRELLPRLARLGWPVRLFVGSVGAPGVPTHAGTFFPGLDVWPHDYTGAVETFARGGDSLSCQVPMHPSYEDRVRAADPIFTSVPPELLELQIRAWQQTFAAGGMGRCEVAHLHHLTPQADAVRRSWPHLPIVGHLHGTELKMLAELERRRDLAHDLGSDLGADRGGDLGTDLGTDPSADRAGKTSSTRPGGARATWRPGGGSGATASSGGTTCAGSPAGTRGSSSSRPPMPMRPRACCRSAKISWWWFPTRSTPSASTGGGSA